MEGFWLVVVDGRGRELEEIVLTIEVRRTGSEVLELWRDTEELEVKWATMLSGEVGE